MTTPGWDFIFLGTLIIIGVGVGVGIGIVTTAFAPYRVIKTYRSFLFLFTSAVMLAPLVLAQVSDLRVWALAMLTLAGFGGYLEFYTRPGNN